MNDGNHNSNPWWDYVEPECRWAPQCHRLLIPGGCDQCDFMNPDLPRNEDGEPYSIPECPDPLI